MTADARNREDDHQGQAAPPETAPEVDRGAAGIALGTPSRQDAGDQQTAQERIQQPGKADVNLLGREAPAADDRILRPVREQPEHIPSQGKVQRKESAEDAKDGQGDLGQMPEDKGVQDISTFISRSNDLIAEICQKRAVSEMRAVKEIAASVADNISKSNEADTKGLIGLDTGFKKLNEMTHGWRKGDLIILAARPSVGKTTLGINLAFQTAVRERVPVAFFSLEMTAEQVVEKLIACRAMVPGDHITTGYLSTTEKRKISAAVSEISRTQLYFDDTPNAKLGDIISKAHRLKKEHSDLGFIVVDYLGRIRYSDHPNIAQRQQEISEISGALKTLARELDVPVLCIAQLNRNVDQNENKVPSLSNLRDSGSIEQDADVCMLLYRSDYYTSLGQKAKDKGKNQNQNKPAEGEENEEGEAPEKKKDDKGVSETQVIVAKNRKGQTGIVHLVFQKAYSRFDDPTPEYEIRMAQIEASRNGFNDE